MGELELHKDPTLKEFQEYVKNLEQQRGFADQTAIEKCLLLGEEMGELFKAVRKAMKLKTDVNANVGSVKEELADIFIYVCAIANTCSFSTYFATLPLSKYTRICKTIFLKYL